jgi:hypothetical protein
MNSPDRLLSRKTKSLEESYFSFVEVFQCNVLNKNFNMRKYLLFVLLLFSISIAGCLSRQKDLKTEQLAEEIASVSNKKQRLLKQTKEYPSEVVFKWIDMQLRLFRTNATPIGGLPPTRYSTYSAIALYESVVPGMPAYQTLSGQLTDMPVMPQTLPGFAYHWPTCANAALAAISKNFFPNTSSANKNAMDSLENALNKIYQAEINNEEFQRSVQFGKAVAQLVFDWSKTDGASDANSSYTPPAGPGLWAPTPPAFAAAFGPYWGNIRLLVRGSLTGSEPSPPPAYSTDPSSQYYQMVKEVYDVSKILTPEQIAIGLFWRDNPGYGDAHYLSILKQILEEKQPQLDLTAFAFAKTCIAMFDAGIGCWKTKYQYNLERPIKYIREVLGHHSWNPLFATPNFPEFPSGHSTIAGAFADVVTGLFGSNCRFTDYSYDYLGMAPHSYNSFSEMVDEVCMSRVYAGIHYRISCERGARQGKKIGQNIEHKLHFLK